MPIAHLLHPYQLDAARSIAHSRAKLLADQPGLGKTFTSLGALELSGALTAGSVSLILAPGTVCDSAWAPTIQAHLPEVNLIDGYSGTRAARNRRIESSYVTDKPNLILINHDSLGIDKHNKMHLPALYAHVFQAIIIDESQYVLPMDYDFPQQATQFWRGLMELNGPNHTRPDTMRLAMSGTPDRGKDHYRFGTWRFLMPNLLAPSRVLYQDWLHKHFVTFMVDIPVRTKSGDIWNKPTQKVGRMRNPEIWASIDRAFMIRRTKAEVAPQLPPKQYIDLDLAYPTALNTAYHQYTTEFLQSDDGSQDHAATFALRAQQWATCQWEVDPAGQTVPIVGGKSGKLDWLVEWLQVRGYVPGELHNLAGGKVVITSQFTRVLRWLQAELDARGIGAQLLTGKETQATRRSVQESFQHGSLRIVLLSAKMGVGIDLDAADDLVFMDIPRDPDTQEQIEDRVHRVSRMHQVTIWRLRSRGTIDMAISATNDKVFQRTRGMMDGSRGVKFARSILARL